MRRLSKILGVAIVAISILSCEKYTNDHQPSQTLKGKDAGYHEKDVKMIPSCSLVLVPSANRPRIGFIMDGSDPFGAINSGIPFIDGVSSSSGVLTREIINPNQFLGLPIDVAGITFTGLAVNESQNVYDPSIILCRSRTSEHALFFASLNAASNYSIDSYLTVTASFAPASDGWILSFIEYHNSVMYGVFYKQSIQTSKVAQISKTTGVATLVKTFSGFKFEGMDFSSLNGVPDKMYLKSGAQIGNTTCRVHVLDLVNTSNTSVLPTNIPTDYSMNSSPLGSFLVYSPGLSAESPVIIYDPLAYAIYRYNPATYVRTTFCTGRTLITLTSPITVGSTQTFGGQAMNDAARY